MQEGPGLSSGESQGKAEVSARAGITGLTKYDSLSCIEDNAWLLSADL